jgi:hypothetical protein
LIEDGKFPPYFEYGYEINRVFSMFLYRKLSALTPWCGHGLNLNLLV